MDTFVLLADPTRRRILELVWNSELPASKIAAEFETTFGAVSQHLARLRAAGVVTVRRDGKQRLYRADRARLGPLAVMMEAMWNEKLAALQYLAETEQQIDTPN